MHTDADFLAAVAATPTALTRLVYADWLDEQGDPRAELIRHEELMREWPAFSDEYWQAKPRRAELRKQFDPAWVRAMGYGVSLPPLFRHGWPDDLRGRWRLIREMYELSTGHPMPDVGGQPQLIAQAETNLQDTLPEAVAHFVAFARDRAAFDSLRRFAGLTDFSAQQDLEFIWLFETDGGGDYLCVRRADWHLPDPPVVHAPPIDGDPETGLVFDTPDAPPSPLGTLSEYILATILNAHGTGGEWGDRVPTGAVRERLTERFGPPVSVAFRNGVEEDVFETVDVLIRLEDEGNGSAFLRVSVRPGGVAAVRDLLDFPPTSARYRGGAFLPAELAAEGEARRMTTADMIAEATFRVQQAFPDTRETADLPTAARWLRFAADLGDAECAYGVCQLHEAEVIRLTPDEQARYLLLACETNRPMLRCLAAMCHLTGRRLSQDDAAAVALLRRTVASNAPRVSLDKVLLGLCYRDGRGVPADRAEAEAWLRRAAAANPRTESEVAAFVEEQFGEDLGALCRAMMPPLLRSIAELPGDERARGSSSARREKPDKLNARK